MLELSFVGFGGVLSTIFSKFRVHFKANHMLHGWNVVVRDVPACMSGLVTFLMSRAREALRQCLPEPLKDDTFASCLKVLVLDRWLSCLRRV
jgi:hypothetical protein